jgi:hypothetical protein
MTKQFLLAAAPPSPGAAAFCFNFRRNNSQNPRLLAPSRPPRRRQSTITARPALSPRQSPLRPCPAPCAAAITRGGRTRINDSHATTNNHSNEVHVGQVNIHTPATDAPGLAGTIGPAIEQSFLTTQANYGLA